MWSADRELLYGNVECETSHVHREVKSSKTVITLHIVFIQYNFP